MDSKIKIKILLFFAIFYSTNCIAVEFKGKFIQGHFIIGKTKPDTKIAIDKKIIKVSKDGYFAFGIEKDRKFDITITEGNKKIVKKIKKRKYKIQKIDGLPKKKVTPPEEFYVRIKKENRLIGKAREIDSNLAFFKEKFIIPVNDAIITCGDISQRMLNVIPK